MSATGHCGVLLDVDLSSGQVSRREVPAADYEQFLGGRGLGAKLLWDLLPEPGVDALGPDNPLLFMPGPFSGFPIPSASRTCVVTKSPCTSPLQSPHAGASTVSYSNIGGFLGPEIRLAGYDGLLIRGQAAVPVYLRIEDDQVEICEAGELWGMGTDAFDRELEERLGAGRFRTAYVGPAGERRASRACIVHTAARAAGRGVGAVMGSKNLKAIALRGTGMPSVADHRAMIAAMDKARQRFKSLGGRLLTRVMRGAGTASVIELFSARGVMSVRNFREGTFREAARIGAAAAREQAWVRDLACYCCRLSCKKSGAVLEGPHATLVHDGPEYETGVMFGANLMISDFNGLMKAIFDGDDQGLDIISTGGAIGFLMEAREKGHIDASFLDGVDLRWGEVDGVLEMIGKIARREGVGDLASQGVKALSQAIGPHTASYAIHVKGLELAAHNVQANPPRALCYATANRGACHLNGDDKRHQDFVAAADCLGLCLFASNNGMPAFPGLDVDDMAALLRAITGSDWDGERLLQLGERVFNLERRFNLREGFARADDALPDRFFDEPFTIGRKKGAVLDRDEFAQLLEDYYEERGWDRKTGEPRPETLKSLGLEA